MINLPPKIITFPQKCDHIPSISEHFPRNHFDPPKYVDLRAFYWLSRVAFTHFLSPNPPVCQDWGGVSQFWQCQDFGSVETLVFQSLELFHYFQLEVVWIDSFPESIRLDQSSIVVCPHVPLQSFLFFESLSTYLTSNWWLVLVLYLVIIQRSFVTKCFSTFLTAMRFLTDMIARVNDKILLGQPLLYLKHCHPLRATLIWQLWKYFTVSDMRTLEELVWFGLRLRAIIPSRDCLMAPIHSDSTSNSKTFCDELQAALFFPYNCSS